VTKKSVGDFDDDPSGLMSAALTGELDVNAALAEFAATPDGAAPVEGLEPDPAPAPVVEPDPTDDEPEPVVEPGQHAEPAWFKDLPEAALAEARKLHQTTEGQRRALKRRADAQAAAESERRDAIAIAVQLRRDMMGKTVPAGEPGELAREQPKGEYLDLDIDNEGNARIPVAKLQEVIDRRAQEIGGRHAQAQTQAQATGQYANKILADAGVSDATSQRFLEAIQYTQARLREAMREGGRVPRNPYEERQMLAELGVDSEIANRFGGLRVVDVYDVYEGARNPYEHGHRLVDITKRYQDHWGEPSPGGPARRSPPPSPIKEHPASMARKGVGSAVGVQPGDSAAHDIMNMSVDEALAMTKDPKRIEALFEKWEKEVSASRH
jgi:hypothetical protein